MEQLKVGDLITIRMKILEFRCTLRQSGFANEYAVKYNPLLETLLYSRCHEGKISGDWYSGTITDEKIKKSWQFKKALAANQGE
jgi:hypothetical protein|tara:strand:+ start:1291 stop:1542 length:252 start_codon:yes stop_codon:yes gene_type:complete